MRGPSSAAAPIEWHHARTHGFHTGSRAPEHCRYAGDLRSIVSVRVLRRSPGRFGATPGGEAIALIESGEFLLWHVEMQLLCSSKYSLRRAWLTLDTSFLATALAWTTVAFEGIQSLLHRNARAYLGNSSLAWQQTNVYSRRILKATDSKSCKAKTIVCWSQSTVFRACSSFFFRWNGGLLEDSTPAGSELRSNPLGV